MASDTQYEMKASAQKKVKALPGNTRCCDCGAPNPDWASLSFGNMVCLQCSGVHRYVGHFSVIVSTIVYVINTQNNSISLLKYYISRSLGTHISFVRSVDMDSWTPDQIKLMKLGGNQQCNQFLLDHGDFDPYTTSIREKYDNPIAQLYKEILKARLSGSSEPSTEEIVAIRQAHLDDKLKGYTASLAGTSEVSDDEDDIKSVTPERQTKISRNQRRLSSWTESIQKSLPERFSIGWMKRTLPK